MNLRSVRNAHAVRRIAKRPPAVIPAPKWTPLSEPVFPQDTADRMRAQSLLAGPRYRDGSSNPDTLTLDQARDVLRWASGAIH